MKTFDTVISRDASGRLTVIEIPFDAKEVFCRPKRTILCAGSQNNSNAVMLESCAFAIAICGERSVEGMKEFLYADCAAAAQNMLLAIHSLGLGGVWCGVAANSDWRKLLIYKLTLPPKLEPVTVLAVGWPDGEKRTTGGWQAKNYRFSARYSGRTWND